MSHMANLIVRADKEVFLATNYWINSVASSYITNAIRELSRRAGERGTKIVLKVIYDRGSPKQLVEPHYFVSEKEYLSKAVNLPKPEDIPNIDMEVMNFHRPMLGTFHCKYMIVDRKYAVLQSNNIQDNDNVEMMIHMEGPIVDSMYDMALMSWDKKLDPMLPSINTPAAQGGLGTSGEKSYQELHHNQSLQGAPGATQQGAYGHRCGHVRQPGVIPASEGVQDITNQGSTFATGPSTDQSVLGGSGNQIPSKGWVGEITEGLSRQRIDDHGQPGEQAVEPSATIGTSATASGERRAPGYDEKSREYFKGSGEQTIPEAQIQHPNPDGHSMPENTPEDPHYDVDIAGEVARVQAAVSPKPGETRMEAVTRHLNHTTNKGFRGTSPECATGEEMTPYIPHPVHEPFPMAMVCREPYGPPNHHSVYNPQNEVWLSALRHAKKNVFIQTPTLNAEPLVPAIIEACERGIDVYCYICLGYNDTVSARFLDAS